MQKLDGFVGLLRGTDKVLRSFFRQRFSDWEFVWRTSNISEVVERRAASAASGRIRCCRSPASVSDVRGRTESDEIAELSKHVSDRQSSDQPSTLKEDDATWTSSFGVDSVDSQESFDSNNPVDSMEVPTDDIAFGDVEHGSPTEDTDRWSQQRHVGATAHMPGDTSQTVREHREICRKYLLF